MEELDMLSEEIELVDIDLDIDGNIKPPKNDKVALIDADTIAFTACLNVEEECEVLPQEFYSDEELEPKIKDGVYYNVDELAAIAKAKEKIDRILDKTGCKEVELHFTGGHKNFRYDIYPDYKANRKDIRSPDKLREVKEALCKIYKGTIHTKWEADDAVVYYYNDAKHILCAVDKDVLNSIPGRHFNYYESGLYNIEMKWVEIDKYTSITWKYLQTLTGDKTDNIIGLKGIGPKKAQKILDGLMTNSELWKAVEEAYKIAGRTSEEALLNLNLVDMNLLQEDLTIKLHTLEELRND